MNSNNYSNIHDLATEFAIEASIAKKKGDLITSNSLFKKAFSLEKRFAETIPSDKKYQLTRSVIYRSAANLALLCNKIEEATHLAQFALSNDPHPSIVSELNEVIEKASKALQQTIPTFYIKGKLISADIPNSIIKIQDTEANIFHLVFVPKTKLSEMVKNFWEDDVVIRGKQRKEGGLVFEDIRRAA